jgi:hypothetical protein
MDDYRSFSSDSSADWDFPDSDEPCMEPPPCIGTDERRMHVRAYDHWLALLNGRSYPAIADLDADEVSEFRAHSVLLDFSEDPVNPRVAFLGWALREEGGLEGDIDTVADVPPRSLISRLTDHYDEILANRAPVGFEAEFVSHRNEPTLYRGILMPYSSDGETIDYIYGVINWKLAAEQDLAPDIVEALTTAFAGPAQPAHIADPVEPFDHASLLAPSGDDFAMVDLEEMIDDARDLATEARDSEGRSHAALYRAISVVYDLALAGAEEPDHFAALIESAGLKQQARAPMTPIVKLVFGLDYDRKRISEYAAVLTHASRLCLAPGMVETWLAGFPGGIKAIVAHERRDRRPALKIDRAKSARVKLREAPAVATVDLGDPAGDEFVLLVARRGPDGQLQVLSPVTGDRNLVDRALRHVAG